jgi:hypothetical protein
MSAPRRLAAVQGLAPKASVSVPGAEPKAEPLGFREVIAALGDLATALKAVRDEIVALRNTKPDDSAIRELAETVETELGKQAPLLREVIDGQVLIVHTLNQPVLPVIDEKTGRIKHAQRKAL